MKTMTQLKGTKKATNKSNKTNYVRQLIQFMQSSQILCCDSHDVLLDNGVAVSKIVSVAIIVFLDDADYKIETLITFVRSYIYLQ